MRARTWTLAALVIAGLLSVAVAAAADGAPEECATSGSSLSAARAAYGDTCSLPRIDCDRIDGTWYCSSRVIGRAAPGGVSADDVGRSRIGQDPPDDVIAGPDSTTTTAAVGPPTTAPAPAPPPSPSPSPGETTTAPPAPSTPTTAPPTTAPAGPPTTAPPGEAPPDEPGSTTTAPPPTVTAPADPPGEPGPDATVWRYPANDGPERNPMKGWNSGWSDDRPESTVGFQYIKWSDLEPRNGVFDFDAVEDVINRSGSRNRHVILRLYCDWWGDSPASRGCPDWIYAEVGVERIRGDNGKYITDYNDPRFLNEAVQAIQALGDRYDDDPRIYAFQLGVIGYWGEWHTYQSRIDGRSYEITEATERRIIEAYQEAFDRVHLMARYPYRSTPSVTPGIGFHNDYFRPNNGHSAEFDRQVEKDRKWMQGPIGGEAPPGLGSDDFYHLYATSQGREMIETGHYSTMKPSSVSSQHRASHLELHKRFGYNLRIDYARFAPATGRSGSVPVEVRVENVGIAPLYYDWDVQFALLDQAGREVAVVDSAAVDLRRAMPGDALTLAGELPVTGLDAGSYRLGVRILQPGADEAKAAPWRLTARNTYILFANDLPVIDGRWGNNHRLVGGWSVLGSVTVP